MFTSIISLTNSGSSSSVFLSSLVTLTASPSTTFLVLLTSGLSVFKKDTVESLDDILISLGLDDSVVIGAAFKCCGVGSWFVGSDVVTLFA